MLGQVRQSGSASCEEEEEDDDDGNDGDDGRLSLEACGGEG